MKWRDLSSFEIDQLDRRIPVFMNIAAIEQHGRHLPLATDALIGEHFLDELEAAVPDQVLVLPQIQVGCSGHHLDFAGTLSVRHETMLHYVTDIVASVRQAGFANVVILNSHGGNQGIGQVMSEVIGQRSPDLRIVFTTWWRLAADRLTGISDGGPFSTGHACEFETSLMMIIAPELVKEPIPAGVSYQPSFDWSDGGMMHGPKASLYRSMKDISGGTGVVGEPSLATSEKGRAISAAVNAALVQMASDLARAEAPRT
jgi:creatinine amidohydrolase